MKRHQNKWLALSDGADLDSLIEVELYDALKRYGPFASAHELVAVLQEGLDEFRDSVKARDPDPKELLQVCAIAKRGLIELCQQARDEMKAKEASKMKVPPGFPLTPNSVRGISWDTFILH